MRPASMLEPWPHWKVERHSGIGYEVVQALDVPVLQMVEQLPNVLQFFTTHLPVIAEQVIDVPKISQDRTQQRLGDCLRQPQRAEQLVEVPTIVSYSSLQGIVEQNVDIPVPRGRRRPSRLVPETGFNRMKIKGVLSKMAQEIFFLTEML